MTSKYVDEFIHSQIEEWELARGNYENLRQVEVKKIAFQKVDFLVQFNPKRIISSAAAVDAKSIQERKCFLCPTNLPQEQKGIDFGGKYQILVNPFPIFPKHLTIPAYEHLRQEIRGRMEDMLLLAESLEEYVIFYNGPKCGASAPDHIHFQAGNKGFLPLENNFERLSKEIFVDSDVLTVGTIPDYPCPLIFIESENRENVSATFSILEDILETKEGEYEPMMNILAWKSASKYILCVFPREQHRPSCFFAEGEDNILLSPASVDMGGVFITPQEKDFLKISELNKKISKMKMT